MVCAYRIESCRCLCAFFVRGPLADQEAALCLRNMQISMRSSTLRPTHWSLSQWQILWNIWQQYSRHGQTLEVMHECGVHYIVFSSTAATPGAFQKKFRLLKPLAKPINPYGSKLMMETIMRWADQPRDQYVPLRYFNVAVPSQMDPSEKTMDQRPILADRLYQWPKANARRSLFLEMTTRHQMAPMFRDYVHPFDFAMPIFLAVEHSRNGNPSTAF